MKKLNLIKIADRQQIVAVFTDGMSQEDPTSGKLK
jgi:hypothetical protein